MDKRLWEETIKQHSGKVIFVNVWATWCSPCRKEFPDINKIQENFKGENFQMISISADYPDEIKTKILPFLSKFNIDFPVFVQNFKDSQDFINMINKKWNGALPATMIIDKKGRISSFSIGLKDYNYFESEIKKLL